MKSDPYPEDHLADEEEFFPCICCGMDRQEDSGFCMKCEKLECPYFLREWESSESVE